MANNTGNVIAALAAGAVIGVGVGILLAPDKGSKTRQKIKDGFNSSKDDILEKLNDFFDDVKTKVNNVVPDFEEMLDQTMKDNKESKEAMIALLEKKLEALKNAK